MTSTRLGDLVSVKSGFAFKSADWLDAGVPVIKIANVKDGWVAIEGCSFVSEKVARSALAFELAKGDVLISMTGHIGQVAKVRDEGRMLLNQRVGRFSIKSRERIDAEYLFQWLRLPKVRAVFEAHAYGAAQPNISPSLIEQQSIPLPPLPVQRRIGSILSAYDDLIENNTRRIAILEEMARRIYEEWFVRFRFPGHEGVRMVESELGLVPDFWRRLPLAEFGDVVTGKTPSKAVPAFYGTDVAFLKTPDMHGNLFILATGEGLSRGGADSQRSKTIPARSLCVSCIGTIGVVSITTEPCQTNQQINSLVPVDAAALEFLYFRLKDSKKTLENLGANGATMGNVNKSKFEALLVLTPTRDLLQVFHAAVAPMFSLIEALSRKNVNLRTTRDLLLPKLISGELDVSAVPEPQALAA